MNIGQKSVVLSVFRILLLIFALQIATGQAAEPDASSNDPAAQEFAIPDEEKPFWESAQTFIDAYSNRDAKAIGDLFTEDAEFFDEFGESTVGRAAIVALYEDVFATDQEASVNEINIERVRFVTADVALEEGVVTTTEFAGGPRKTSRYIALHVKGQDGNWKINTLKDYSSEKNSRVEQLEQLSWMLGEWVSEDSSSVVHTGCRWSDDGNYLLRQFTVKIAGSPVMNGVQRIGWDPLRKQLRSWGFDSEGGFMQGEWKQIGSNWVVISSGVNADGETTSGVAIYKVHDSERVSWHYRDRVIGNELSEDIEPILMTRRPPAPNTAD